MGVNKKATNIAVVGELVRIPFHVDIITAMFKYIQRLSMFDENHLLSQALQDSRNLEQTGTKSWYSCINSIAHDIGVGFNDTQKVKTILINRYKSFWRNQIEHNGEIKQGKLRTYCKFKYIFEKEPYLKYVTNSQVRKSLTQFRISAHDLAIERGRYKNIDKDKRICKLCSNNDIEDECHFLLNCKAYDKERTNLLENVQKYCSNFKSLNNDLKFIWLLSCEDKLICNELASFIHKSFDMRQTMLKST